MQGPLEIGELPPVGEVPKSMWAQVIRSDRLGSPSGAFRVEEVPVPTPGPGEVLIAVMAAGINFNNVWAARGYPIDVIKMRQRRGATEDFHIGGSDLSGLVYALGDGVEDLALGDGVVSHPGWWDPDDPWVQGGKDPMLAPSASIWGYDTNFGSFAQFAILQSHQVLPKAPHLSWEEAAAPMLVGTTAYRMLLGWDGNRLASGDLVLVWGGSGGLGGQAIQLARVHNATAIAVVSDDERGKYCEELGAIGYINRKDFSHWGIPPALDDREGQRQWTEAARSFGKRIWDIAGERRSPEIVFEHPGEATIPTSVFSCETGGMVVICAGTTGYSAFVDLRYHWVRQKRLQGSHGTNDEQAKAYNDLLHQRRIDPCLGHLYRFDEIPAAHMDMEKGIDVFGNRVALVGAKKPTMGQT